MTPSFNATIEVVLRPGKEESLKRFHPWVFSGAIGHIKGDVREGDLVRVSTNEGQSMGIGHYAPESIAVRMLSFDPAQPIDVSFFSSRLRAAWRLRRNLKLISPTNTAFRLVHGEGDHLPGLVIDVYSGTAVMQAHSAGMHYCRHLIAKAVVDTSEGLIKAVYYKSESTLPYKAELEHTDGFLYGKSDHTSPAIEAGLRFRADWLRGQKTGFFVDQRVNRAKVELLAAGRQVLNLFCYTGGFSLYALRGGAERVVSVDSSAKAIDLCKENVALNFDQNSPHEAVVADAFRFLHESPDNAYNLMILDPPAFAKHRRVLKNALVGYRRLNTAAFRRIAPGGIIFTFSCSQAVSREEFRLAVFSSAAASGRKACILDQLTQPADHPISIYHPEGEYLKGLVIQVD